ncbi:MAG: transposase [Tepidimonas sp.]|uniref:transposase n=1 Tax=Tepidimonas sp. TaxID=2002775 RepID=UPI00259EAA03|nr:transposase [Tepidimonas sp.]MDM7456514.1 transposase [Tepidimonas sp.]
MGLQTLTLDLDSTVLSRCGAQQGASRGDNPSKRGRASHHPHMAFVADTRMLANVWLRPDNAHTANNAIALLQSGMEHLGSAKRVGLLRADSGFCDKGFLQHLEPFWATEAAMHWVMLAFNLMSLFRAAMQRQIHKTSSMQTMASLRQRLFAQAGFIPKNGRSRTLKMKMATAMQRHEWVSGLWNAAKFP